MHRVFHCRCTFGKLCIICIYISNYIYYTTWNVKWQQVFSFSCFPLDILIAVREQVRLEKIWYPFRLHFHPDPAQSPRIGLGGEFCPGTRGKAVTDTSAAFMQSDFDGLF